MKNSKKIIFITSKSIFTISLVVVTVTILIVFITGLKINRSIIDNSLISLSILSFSFFTFVTCGLYFGLKLRDNIGDLTKQIKWESTGSGFPDFGSGGGASSIEVGAEHGGIEGIILAILLWIVVTIILVFLIVFFEAIVWALLMIFLGMLYWIFYRALRLVFKNSIECKGNFSKSALLGFKYTVLYSSWIYGIVLVADIIQN